MPSIESNREKVQRIVDGLPSDSDRGKELIRRAASVGDPALLECLPDLLTEDRQDKSLRLSLARALGDPRFSGAVDRLISIVESNFESLPRFDNRSESVDLEVRCTLALALGALGNKKAVDPLKRLLSYLQNNRRQLKNATSTNVRQEMGSSWDERMRDDSLCMVNVLKGLIPLGGNNDATVQFAIDDLLSDVQWVRDDQDWLRSSAKSPEDLRKLSVDLLETSADELTLSDAALKLRASPGWSPTPRQSLIQAIALKQSGEAERIARAHPGDALSLVLHPATSVRLNACVLMGKVGDEASLSVLKMVGGKVELVEAAQNAIDSIMARCGLVYPRASDAEDPSEYWDPLTPSPPLQTVVPSPALLSSFVTEAPRVAARFKSPGELEEFVGYMEDRNKLAAVRQLRALTKCSVVEGKQAADEAELALLKIRLRVALKIIQGPGSELPVVATPVQPEPDCTVMLKAAGQNTISVIKVVREVTCLGLKEARDLIEGAPTVLKEGITKEEAEAILKSLSEAGAEGEIAQPTL